MRSNEIFARMNPEAALAFLSEIHAEAPAVEEVALSAAAGAFRLRPVFLRRQPRKRQAEWMRQALARTAMAAVAEEVLAEYFLEYHADLLGEWLDALATESDDTRSIATDLSSALLPDLKELPFDRFTFWFERTRRYSFYL